MIRLRASSTRSAWKRRSSKFGAGSVMLFLLAGVTGRSPLFTYQVKWIHNAAHVVGGLNTVLDIDQHRALILLVDGCLHAEHLDAGLPELKRFLDVAFYQ